MDIEVGRIYRDTRPKAKNDTYEDLVEVLVVQPSWLYKGRTWALVKFLDGGFYRVGRTGYIFVEDLA